jgi:hypothetical protein
LSDAFRKPARRSSTPSSGAPGSTHPRTSPSSAAGQISQPSPPADPTPRIRATADCADPESPPRASPIRLAARSDVCSRWR